MMENESTDEQLLEATKAGIASAMSKVSFGTRQLSLGEPLSMTELATQLHRELIRGEEREGAERVAFVAGALEALLTVSIKNGYDLACIAAAQRGSNACH